jgi:hypothetical protein
MTVHRLQRGILAAIAAVTVLATTTHTQTLGEPEDFSASAIDVNTGWTGRIDISINRWSTPAERSALVTTLFEKGTDALLSKLQDMKPVGRIRTPGSIGYDLRYAQQRKLPDGDREIVVATDRPMRFSEITNRPRSADYPFTWAQLRIRPDGTGRGQLAVAARITGDADDRSIEVEDFALQPVRLENVKAEKHRDN